MSDVKIIALVGMPGSGKGTCTDYLSTHYNWPIIHFGNMVYDEVQRRGLHNVKDEKFVRRDMREKEGKEVLAKHAKRMADTYAAEGHNVIVFDGLYSWSEYKYLRREYGDDLTVIATAAPRLLRYERILNRKDSHRKYSSAQEIIDRETSEIEELEKGGPIANADYTILNDESPELMLEQLTKILTRAHII
jgi:dephospho-CoA kinase